MRRAKPSQLKLAAWGIPGGNQTVAGHRLRVFFCGTPLYGANRTFTHLGV